MAVILSLKECHQRVVPACNPGSPLPKQILSLVIASKALATDSGGVVRFDSC